MAEIYQKQSEMKHEKYNIFFLLVSGVWMVCQQNFNHMSFYEHRQ